MACSSVFDEGIDIARTKCGGDLELEDEKFYSPFLFGGDEDFINTLELTLIEGTLPSATNRGSLVNETFVRYFDLKDPVGQKIPGDRGEISGVVKDFTVGSFKQEIPPVIISYYENGRALLIDYSSHNLGRLIEQLRKEWAEVFPDRFFDYQVIQEDLLTKHNDEIFLSRMVIAFSLLSIVLSCFGLFALSWAVVHNRTKEIGIRKVLGATSADILNLLTLSFTKRIALAFVIAAPISYYLMNKWLQGFVNRIELDAWIFVISALVMGFVSALALSVQTLKATITSPVAELRQGD